MRFSKTGAHLKGNFGLQDLEYPQKKRNTEMRGLLIIINPESESKCTPKNRNQSKYGGSYVFALLFIQIIGGPGNGFNPFTKT
jgi:hypothetical protein